MVEQDSVPGWPERLRYHLNLLKYKTIRRGKWLYSFLRYYFPGSEELPSDVRPVFVLSTGRTGTTFLGTVLDRIPEVVARHEPQPDCFDLGVMMSEERISPTRARTIVRACRWWVGDLVRENRARVYVEANHYLFSLVPILSEVYPDAHFVRIVRDGRDVVRSFYDRSMYALSCNYDYPRADRVPGDRWAEEWGALDRFEKICWYWQFKDRYLVDALKEISEERIVNLRFEDIFDEERGYPGMEELCNQLGGSDVDWEDWMDRPIRSTSDYTLSSWDEWDETCRERFDRIAGEHLRACGYSWS